jgi:hypothetical protein
VAVPRVAADVEAVTMQTILQIILVKLVLMDGEVAAEVEVAVGVPAETVDLVG